MKNFAQKCQFWSFGAFARKDLTVGIYSGSSRAGTRVCHGLPAATSRCCDEPRASAGSFRVLPAALAGVFQNTDAARGVKHAARTEARQVSYGLLRSAAAFLDPIDHLLSQ